RLFAAQPIRSLRCVRSGPVLFPPTDDPGRVGIVLGTSLPEVVLRPDLIAGVAAAGVAALVGMLRPITAALIVVGAVIGFLPGIGSGVLVGILIRSLIGVLLGCPTGVVARLVIGVAAILFDIVRGGVVVAGVTVHLGQRLADRVDVREAPVWCAREVQLHELLPDRAGEIGPVDGVPHRVGDGYG